MRYLTSFMAGLALTAGALMAGSGQAADPSSPQKAEDPYFQGLSVIGSLLHDDFIFYHDAEREKPWHGPTCDDDAVLAELRHDFDDSERLYRDPKLSLRAVSHVREVATRQWDDDRYLMARRYCEARAHLSDGRDYRLVYWIRSDEGFAGAGWGVTHCMVGRDIYYAYQPACQGLRPQ
ncbi:MAG: hypothetical protein AAFX39_09945 [Pseudomonadota bacterium]